MNQFGINNTANIGTYNDVAGNQTNNNYITINPESNIQELADIAAIRSLKIAENPSGSQHQTCTANTRVQILDDIRKWADDTTTASQVLWLADRAGTGKSTVAKQIAKDWEGAAKPVASFFFSINAADTRINARFCPTIAAKLADLPDFGSFRSTLAEGLKQKITFETHSFEEQFEELLVTPLKATNKPVLIIIDALDECNKKDRYELLSVLLRRLDQLPMVRVLITSRPEPDIAKLLQNNGLVRFGNLRGTGEIDSTAQDILQYVSDFFTHSDNLQSIQPYAPKLAKASNGLFIYASTACKYLQDSLDPEVALATIESINGLDDLYSEIMERAIRKDDTVSLQAASSILQAILAAQRPLSVSEMQTLLKRGQVVQSVVKILASVLSSGAEDQAVEILHPTFQEYLTDRDRSGVYFIDVKKGHKSLAIGCLGICSENTAKELLETNTSALEYATLYWPNHVIALLRGADAQEDTRSLEDQIISFFKKDLIRWFELIVLLKAVYQCSNNLATLERCTGISSAIATSRTHERTLWCRDAHRFLQYHQVAIEQDYMHIRRALAFTPRESLIYKGYFTAFARQIPAVSCGIPTEWPSYQILLGHVGSVSSVSFSPDGTRIVSGSTDNTLRLWDGVIGASIGGPMKGHDGHISATVFSPDGTRVVSGCWDDILRLWDGSTGASIGGSMKGHTSMVNSVAFSPDGTRIVSGSADRTLRLWDGLTGASIGGPIKGHTQSITSVAFSPDGIRVVSGSEDQTLRLWDGVTGTSIGGPMKGHTSTINSLAFSPDGNRIVSGSRDNTLRLWDGMTGANIGGPMKGHTSGIKSLAFSPDGTRIVSGSRDNTLRLWDGVTGANIYPIYGLSSGIFRLWNRITDTNIGGPMNGHTERVNSVSFSPDGTRIVSGSRDNTLQLWDGVTGANIGGPMKGHTGEVNIVAFSPDGTRIISGSEDHTLRLWDSTISASGSKPLNTHTHGVNSVTFSPDGSRVVSGSWDKTLRLWDGVTGASIGGPMKGHIQSINSVAFSPDGTRIVSGSADSTLRLWDGLTGAGIGGPMKGHTLSIISVAFSPDGTRIVSGSWDDTLRLWDGLTGASIGGPMKGHTSKINSVAFSRDGTRIVSGSWDSTLRLWDGFTGASIGGPMKGHTSMVDSVAFSPDGTRILSSSADMTLRLWDVASRVEVAVVHTNRQTHAFSPCGSYIISERGTWDIRSLPPSLVTGTYPVASYSPVRYDTETRMVVVHTSSIVTFPVSGCQVRVWTANGGRIALGLWDGRVVIVDCTHLL